MGVGRRGDDGVGLGRNDCVGRRGGDGVGLGRDGGAGRRDGDGGGGLAVVNEGANDAMVDVTVSTTLLKNDGLLLLGRIEAGSENSGD